jgi:nucleoside-triphosphatase
VAKRVILLTGLPGVGKTTVLIRVVEGLRANGITVGGIISNEVRENGIRMGFEISDLTNGKRWCLARVNQKSGPRFGRYRVSLEGLDKIGVEAIDRAIEKCEVIAIDEIGPMELYSYKFKLSAERALESKKFVLAVIHSKSKDPLIVMAKQRSDSEIFVVTLADREMLPQDLTDRLLQNIRKFHS